MTAPTHDSVFTRSPDILSGAAALRGTTVPARALFDHLSAGGSLDEFLARFPAVPREVALAAIREAGDLVDIDAGHGNVLDLRNYPALEKVWDSPGDAIFDDL